MPLEEDNDVQDERQDYSFTSRQKKKKKRKKNQEIAPSIIFKENLMWEPIIRNDVSYANKL